MRLALPVAGLPEGSAVSPSGDEAGSQAVEALISNRLPAPPCRMSLRPMRLSSFDFP